MSSSFVYNIPNILFYILNIFQQNENFDVLCRTYCTGTRTSTGTNKSTTSIGNWYIVRVESYTYGTSPRTGTFSYVLMILSNIIFNVMKKWQQSWVSYFLITHIYRSMMTVGRYQVRYRRYEVPQQKQRTVQRTSY